MSDIKPCPHCGESHACVEDIETAQGLKWYVFCYACGATGGYKVTPAKAIEAWNTRAKHSTLTAEQVRETVDKHWHDLSADYDMPEATALPEYSYDWQAIADELNVTLGIDDDYESKMDALLCRLTNGKWSKSRAYDLDFMVSCIDEEYEKAYAEELAVTTQGSTEIVRCRDCKHYDPNDEPSEVYPDRYWCDRLTVYMPPDGFCSFGKREVAGE